MAAPLSPLALRTRWALLRLQRSPAVPPGPGVRTMGLVFPGPVGLAAGFDRHGVLEPHADRLGLGSIEIGTLTAGARRHRLQRVGSRRAPCGVSLGKRPETPWPQAADDFLRAMACHGGRADYLTLNAGRDCRDPGEFAAVVATLAKARGGRRLPLVAKLPAGWLADGDGVEAAAACVAAGADGLLVSAEGRADASATLRRLSAALGPGVCLISVGGIRTVPEALARLRSGARLLQVHRGLVRRGPSLIEAINLAVQRKRPLAAKPSRARTVASTIAGA